ncbi:MAG: hypothetical protein WBM32_17780 [Crocosphaera sp.]|jgi:hypothetical protein
MILQEIHQLSAGIVMKRYKVKPWIILPILALITAICLVGWQTQGIS